MSCTTILHLRNLLENRLLESFLSANPHSPTLANKGTHQYHISIFLWRFHFNDSVVNTFVFRNHTDMKNTYQIWKNQCFSNSYRGEMHTMHSNMQPQLTFCLTLWTNLSIKSELPPWSKVSFTTSHCLCLVPYIKERNRK